jgi:hypothetical protein
MLRTSFILAIGLASAVMQQATNPADDAARQQDVYAVYSTMLANPPVVGGDSNKTYAIAAMTTPSNLDAAAPLELPEELRVLIAACNAPPPGYEDRWSEILSDFRSRGDAPVALRRELKITKPYVYLNAVETATMSSRTPINAPPTPSPEFGGAVAVIRLGNVYFSRDRSLAVTYISSVCGPLCSEGERKVFERIPAGWREVTAGTRCHVSS